MGAVYLCRYAKPVQTYLKCVGAPTVFIIHVRAFSQLLEDGESTGKNSTDYDWETYQDLPELNAWIDAAVARHPEVASILVAGSSFEGRPLKGVRICHGPGRPVVFVEADSGSSDNPRSPHYRGSSPFSEPETRSLSDFLRGLKGRLLVYVSLHTYKQALTWPYGLSYERADNNQELMEVAGISAEALSRRYGTKYQTGTIFDIFGGVSGSSVDRVKKWLGARFVFEYELRDTGGFGLLLPPAQVRPTAEETADSLVAMMREVLARTAAPH